MMSHRRALLCLFIGALVVASSACTPFEVETFAKLSPAGKGAVLDHLAGPSPDCYAAIDRHWPASSRDWARSIVWRESRNIPSAANPSSNARGCWQLMMSYHAGRFTKLGFSPSQWSDPDVNTLVALDLYREVGTSPWRT